MGISRDRMSASGLSAPSLARRSLSSFPSVPSCPLIHLKSVVAIRLRRTCAAYLKKSAFLIPIHPSFSHVGRWVVRPSMAYFESDIIVRGQNLGIDEAATMMAAISPTWLDCWVPGIRIEAFRTSLGPTQTPLPLRASSLPLFIQAPSVYIVIPAWRWFMPRV